MAPKVLLIRPQSEMYETTDLLVTRGYEPVIAPLLAVHFTTMAALPPGGGYIFTSANGVKAFLAFECDKTTPLYAVGQKTATLLKKAGYQAVHQADGEGKSLVQLIEATTPKTQKLVHLSGNHLAVDIASELKAKGIPCHRETVYETTYLENLPPQVSDQIKSAQIQAVLLYSPKSADAFIKAAPEVSNMHGVCLSKAVAEVLDPRAWAGIHIAPQKTTEALLDQLDQIDFRCHNGNSF